MLGIFVALQAEDRNQDRMDRQLEQVYILFLPCQICTWRTLSSETLVPLCIGSTTHPTLRCLTCVRNLIRNSRAQADWRYFVMRSCGAAKCVLMILLQPIGSGQIIEYSNGQPYSCSCNSCRRSCSLDWRRCFRNNGATTRGSPHEESPGARVVL